MDPTFGVPQCGKSTHEFSFLCKSLEAWLFSPMHISNQIKRFYRFLKQHLNCFLRLSILLLLLLRHIHSTESSLDGLVPLAHITKQIVGKMNIKSSQTELIAGVYGIINIMDFMSQMETSAKVLRMLLLLMA